MIKFGKVSVVESIPYFDADGNPATELWAEVEVKGKQMSIICYRFICGHVTLGGIEGAYSQFLDNPMNVLRLEKYLASKFAKVRPRVPCTTAHA